MHNLEINYTKFPHISATRRRILVAWLISIDTWARYDVRVLSKTVLMLGAEYCFVFFNYISTQGGQILMKVGQGAWNFMLFPNTTCYHAKISVSFNLDD